MPKMISISREELATLKGRVKKLAMHKSYGQLIISLMNNMSTAPGLDNTIENMLRHMLDIIGGANLILYYTIDNGIYYADVYGKKMQLAQIDDPLVKKVWDNRKPLEDVHDFGDTKMTTPEFSKAYTWVFPLLVGPELIGVCKMDSLPMAMQEFYRQLPPFFNYAALILKNEIRGQTRLQKAYEALEQEIIVRKQVEEDLRKSKEMAEASNKAKSEFLANMSHELRTPLNAILGFSQLMERDPTISQSHRGNLGIINRSGVHLLALINDVLNMSKIEAGLTALDKQSFDLHHTITVIEEMIRSSAGGKGLQFIVKRATDVPRYILTDEPKLRQVLLNLLGNGVKYTDQGCLTLRISGQSPSQTNNGQQTIHFEIEDTGIGIAPDDLDTIFDAFVQKRSAKTSSEGTGLGLTISHKLVQMLGGDISVESVEGKGSVFSFDIPVDLADRIEIEVEKPARRVIGLEPGQPAYTILVVEDNPENLALLSKLLQSVGFEVHQAVNGQEAINQYEKQQPGLIWMDIRMPVMDGYEATQRIKGTKPGRKIPVIALTAQAFEEERQAILAAGCDDLVRKPFQEAEIFDAMEKHLGVRYVYEEGEEEKESVRGALTPGALAELPDDLLEELKQATIDLDVDLIQAIIGRIREINEPVADGLSDLAEGFQYEKILALI